MPGKSTNPGTESSTTGGPNTRTKSSSLESSLEYCACTRFTRLSGHGAVSHTTHGAKAGTHCTKPLGTSYPRDESRTAGETDSFLLELFTHGGKFH